jgi:hypothetical protein
MTDIIFTTYDNNDSNIILQRNKIINQVYTFFRNKEYKSYLDELDKEISLKFHNILFYIIYREKKDIIDVNYIKLIMKRVYFITSNINKQFNIYLLLSPYKKKFNNNNECLTSYNCNNGFTYVNNNSNISTVNIYILRKEEFAKVIIHEIIHHIDKIHSTFSQFNINRLKTHFKIATINLDPNECIIEFWATIMQLKIISIIYKQDFYKLFLNELKYSLYKSFQLITMQTKMANGIWFDETNIYCYIIFKTIIMYNFLEFRKIYTFPYNDTIITDFLIKYSNLPMTVNTNPTTIRKNNSLCFMLYSDK